MKHTRKCCGPDFTILSGDDGLTYEMMTNTGINASGVISVASNVIPKAVADMVHLLEEGNTSEARKLLSAIEPIFNLVTITTTEKTPFGLGFKTLMSILGMPSGGCRQPLGKMTRNGLEKVLEAARKVQADTPEIFQPVAEFFNVDIEARLNDPSTCEGLFYEDY